MRAVPSQRTARNRYRLLTDPRWRGKLRKLATSPGNPEMKSSAEGIRQVAYIVPCPVPVRLPSQGPTLNVLPLRAPACKAGALPLSYSPTGRESRGGPGGSLRLPSIDLPRTATQPSGPSIQSPSRGQLGNYALTSCVVRLVRPEPSPPPGRCPGPGGMPSSRGDVGKTAATWFVIHRTIGATGWKPGSP